MRYRLRTLLILLGVAPPLLAGLWYGLRHEPTVIVAGLLVALLICLGMFWRSVMTM
jgi:hypothetical protein